MPLALVLPRGDQIIPVLITKTSDADSTKGTHFLNSLGSFGSTVTVPALSWLRFFLLPPQVSPVFHVASIALLGLLALLGLFSTLPDPVPRLPYLGWLLWSSVGCEDLAEASVLTAVAASYFNIHIHINSRRRGPSRVFRPTSITSMTTS